MGEGSLRIGELTSNVEGLIVVLSRISQRLNLCGTFNSSFIFLTSENRKLLKSKFSSENFIRLSNLAIQYLSQKFSIIFIALVKLQLIIS